MQTAPKHNVLIIGGDMNAQIGKSENNRFSLHNTSNRNGDLLAEFSLENRLFKHQIPKNGRANYGHTHTQITQKHN